MEYLLVRRYGNRPGGIDDPRDVLTQDLSFADGNDAMGVDTPDMTARNSGVHGVDLAVGHQLGLAHGPLDGLHGGFDVDDHSLAQTARMMGTDTDHLEVAVRRDFADDRSHLARAYVETDNPVSATVGHRALPPGARPCSTVTDAREGLCSGAA